MTSQSPSSRFRWLSLLASGLAAGAVLLSGCGNGLETTAAGGGPVVTAAPATPTGSTSPTATETATATTTETSSAAPTASASSSSTSATAASAGRCTVVQLRVGVRASEGGAAAGSNYVLLSYRNTGSSACVLRGFPGVSFVGHGNGTQLGVPAVRNRTTASRPVTLDPGATTTSLLQIANAGNYDARQCAPTTADGFRVYPPGSRAAVYVPFRAQACQSGTDDSPQLVVSPVGTSG